MNAREAAANILPHPSWYSDKEVDPEFCYESRVAEVASIIQAAIDSATTDIMSKKDGTGKHELGGNPMTATSKGATLTEGLELVIGEHRIIVDSIDCPAKKIRVRAVTSEHVTVKKTPDEDKAPRRKW